MALNFSPIKACFLPGRWCQGREFAQSVQEPVQMLFRRVVLFALFNTASLLSAQQTAIGGNMDDPQDRPPCDER